MARSSSRCLPVGCLLRCQSRPKQPQELQASRTWSHPWQHILGRVADTKSTQVAAWEPALRRAVAIPLRASLSTTYPTASSHRSQIRMLMPVYAPLHPASSLLTNHHVRRISMVALSPSVLIAHLKRARMGTLALACRPISSFQVRQAFPMLGSCHRTVARTHSPCRRSCSRSICTLSHTLLRSASASLQKTPLAIEVVQKRLAQRQSHRRRVFPSNEG